MKSKSKTALPRRGPGRPPGESSARTRILNAAEVVFSERGYALASFDEISKRASVTKALVAYYFGSKDKLFKQVFLRRANTIVAGRLEALDKLLNSSKPYTVSDLLSAYLDPAFAISQVRGGKAFLRMQWRMLHTEPPRFAHVLRRVYDESARRFVAALVKLVPSLTEEAAYWRIVFIIGAYTYIHSDSHRLEDISRGLCRANNKEQMLAQAKAFVLGGLLAPVAPAPSDTSPAPPDAWPAHRAGLHSELRPAR